MRKLNSRAALVVAAALIACHRASPQTAAAARASCAPVAAMVMGRGGLAHLAGTYDLTMVVTSGSRSTAQVTSRLVLRPQDPARRAMPPGPSGASVVQYAVGWTSLLAADVGASETGNAASDLPDMPGVGVYVAPVEGEPASVVMRLGATSNARGPQGLDAAYFALQVQRLTADGSWGVWRSGDGTREVARGHFCASRVDTR